MEKESPLRLRILSLKEKIFSSRILFPFLFVPFLLAVLFLPTSLTAQKKKTPKLPRWKIDPYTKNEPKAMEKAGYVNFGPFPWGDGHDSTKIEKALGKARIIWVETAHFRIGSTLKPWVLPFDLKIRKMYRAELTELKKKLPKVNPKKKVLDRWLRVHLFAHRLEKLYADFMKRMGVTDKSFPTKSNTWMNGEYWGQGPYLGMKNKYTVLLFEKASDHLAYLSTFTGRVQNFAVRHHFKKFGSILLCTAAGLEDGRLRNDVAMHVHVIWNNVHNLIDGYRHYTHDIPVWFKEGMAHWYGRRISPKWNNFDQNESARADLRSTWRWDIAVRKLVYQKKVTPAAAVLKWRDYSQIKFNDHLCIWSRIDYLMKKDPKGFGIYMNNMKGVINKKTGMVDIGDIIKAQRKALHKAWNVSALSLDEKWKEWVLKTYPSR